MSCQVADNTPSTVGSSVLDCLSEKAKLWDINCLGLIGHFFTDNSISCLVKTGNRIIKAVLSVYGLFVRKAKLWDIFFRIDRSSFPMIILFPVW